jgi:flagellar hook-basal body complex protein FliE
MTDPLGLINPSSALNQAKLLNKVANAGAPGADGPTFKDVLLKNIEEVNKLQQDAEAAIEDLAAGRRDDIAQVNIAKQKADMAFKMLLQVRNKMMDAYEEIKQLRV